MIARLKASLPSFREIAGAPLWGLLMALSAMIGLYFEGRLDSADDFRLLAIYFAGGALGWLLMLPFARFSGLGRGVETRFAAFLLWLTVGTTGSTALIFSQYHRAFFAQWHDPFLQGFWVYQFLFTTAGAFYQFAVLGLRLYLPLGFLCLLAASAIMAQRMR